MGRRRDKEGEGCQRVDHKGLHWGSVLNDDGSSGSQVLEVTVGRAMRSPPHIDLLAWLPTGPPELGARKQPPDRPGDRDRVRSGPGSHRSREKDNQDQQPLLTTFTSQFIE